jgi:hypothetical protein
MDFFNVKNELSGSFDVMIKAKGYRPKQGLGPKQLELARQFINVLREDGEAYAIQVYARGMSHCEESEETWMARHVRPFDGQDQRNGVNANIYWAEMPGSKRNRSFEVRPNRIKSVTRKNGGMIVEDKDGSVFTFTKSKGPAYYRAE